ncbi:DUF6279 family lipoprotein [Photobacterium sp. OFAV2-7]|uniref:DUF6279 family lipoprotein n=1 Tax=Photobacterium sp. OFAV2-7 TaxID=2917748 RepID=UPI001EF5F60B|nr:DUF6279 family lipoprotein [Photobacterium sp. OFAV2-7]MCG7587158.1 DUF6279 family lipoprotein [Photobacterium sp. OFAV2-7]
MPQRLTRFATGAFIMLILLGCVMRLGYNTLNYWIPYYLSGYVTLTSSQEKVFDAELDKALAIHRRQELPKIHREIFALQSDLQRPLSFGQVRGYHFSLTALGQDSVALLAKPLAATFKLLDDQQVAQLNGNIQSAIDEVKQEREILTTRQKIEKRASALQETAADWVGTLSSRQKSLLKELAGYQVEMEPEFFTVWYQFLQNWRVLMANRERPDFEAELSRELQRLVALENDAIQAELNFYLNRRFELLRRFNHSLSQSQLRFFDNRLSAIRKDVAVLINQ